MAVKKKFPYRSAFVACNGGCHVTEGSSCFYGCIACGKCVESCKFGAIHLNEHGIAEVDEEKCIACGRCVRECPQHIIHLHDCANTIVVKCSNKDKGKDARSVFYLILFYRAYFPLFRNSPFFSSTTFPSFTA